MSTEPAEPRPAPVVSVLLPVYNGALTLARALESVCVQTLADWETVVLDDGSTDGTDGVLETFRRREPRIRVVRRPHRGLVAALNDGLALCRGTFIARLDADDVCHPDRLAEQAAYLMLRPEVGVVGSLVAFGGDMVRQTGYALHVDWLNSVIAAETIDRQRFVESPLAHPSVMFRRDLVDRHGGYREGPFPEDYELWLRWLEAGVVMTKVPRELLVWHDTPGRLSRVDPRYGAPAVFRCKAGFLARWLKAHERGGRRLIVWGAGRVTRRRVEALEAEGVRVDSYVDVDPHKTRRRPGHLPVLLPDQLPGRDAVFVIGYVGKRGAREFIAEQLANRGFVEGRDFILAA